METSPCDTLVHLLQDGVKQGVFPGAAFAVGDAKTLHTGYAGRFTYSPDSHLVDQDTLWDLASLTKVLATTSVLMLLVRDRHLGLEDKVRTIYPDWQHLTTIRNLLLHESGLPAYIDVSTIRDRATCERRICSTQLIYRAGTQSLYSCVGFTLLHLMLDYDCSNRPYEDWIRQVIFGPLGMRQTFYCPSEEDRPRCAPTSTDPSRQGLVHDPIASLMGGVNGNAGLFATVHDVGRYLKNLVQDDPNVLPREMIDEWTRRHSPLSTRALGWDTKSPTGSSAGTLFSNRSFGHLGYTGTSIWVDPETKIYAALLSNRVYPDETNTKIVEFRPRFYDAAYQLLNG